MKKISKKSLQLGLFIALVTVGIVVFAVSLDKAMTIVMERPPANKYYSADGKQELTLVYGAPTSEDTIPIEGYLVNGQAVTVSGNATNPYRENAKKAFPSWMVVLISFWFTLFCGHLFPSHVVGALNYYTRRLALKLTYRPAKGDSITLPKAPAGVIAVRKWDMTISGELKSLNKGKKWSGLVFEDKEPPVKHSDAGIYSFRLGSNHARRYTYGFPKVMGVVSLSGRVISHHDHVLRSQKATILCLVTTSQKRANKLRRNYYCPVFVNTNPELAIETWMMSEQGLFWQHHNNQLIQDKRVEKMLEGVKTSMTWTNGDGFWSDGSSNWRGRG